MNSAQQKPQVCIDPTMYVSSSPGSIFEEARVLTLGKYLENELSEGIRKQVVEHLKVCKFCMEFIQRLDTPEPAGEEVSLAYAVCPSSKTLDSFLFDRSSLGLQKEQEVDRHLRECPLCRQELDWLKDLEGNKVLEFQSPSGKKLNYLAVAAAVFFLVLSGFLFWQKEQTAFPGKQLQALGIIPEPDQIDYAELANTSSVLKPDLQRVFDQGVTLFRQGNFKDASSQFERVKKEDPKNSAAYFLLGYSYYKLNDPEKAFELCDLAEQMKPKSYERCMFLVNIALKTGHYDRAITEISAMYHEAPDYPPIRDMYQRIMALTGGSLSI